MAVSYSGQSRPLPSPCGMISAAITLWDDLSEVSNTEYTEFCELYNRNRARSATLPRRSLTADRTVAGLASSSGGRRGLRPHRRPIRDSAARAFISPTGDGRPPLSRRGEAHWERAWRQGRVRRGRPLLSRPRGAVGFGWLPGAAAVESAADSVVARSCGVGALVGWDGCFLVYGCERFRPCASCMPVCPRERRTR